MDSRPIKLALNYSPEAIELLSRRAIEFDLFKCADWPDMIAEARKYKPIYVHFPYDVGTPGGRKPDYAAADAMARDTDTPFVNFHFVSYDRDFPQLPRDDSSVEGQVLDRALADVAEAAKNLGPDRILIENIPWFGAGGGYHLPSVSADLLHRIVEQTDTWFLLDLSHARIAAHYQGIEPRKYIESLPVHRLRELHLTGIRPHNGRLADHMELSPEDFKFAQWAIERIRSGDWSRPWTIALEYGGVGEPFKWRSESRVLASDVPRLYELVRSVS